MVAVIVLFFFLQDLYDRIDTGDRGLRDRMLTNLRKLLAAALVPIPKLADALSVVETEATGTAYAELVAEVKTLTTSDADQHTFSCLGTSRAQDAAIQGFFLNLYKDITTGHPRPVVWTYIGAYKQTVAIIYVLRVNLNV